MEYLNKVKTLSCVLLCLTCFHSLLHSSGNIEASKEADVAINETINVFSIASGHLYERFLR